MAMEDYHETVIADSFRFSALMVALLAIAFALIILWGYITGNNKIMSEITTPN